MIEEETNALENEQAYRFSVNNRAFEYAMTQLTAGYPESEISSWERQREEAVAWGDDPNSPTPWIDVAAQARGLPREEFLARTLAKAQRFAYVSAFLVGRRQRIEAALSSAQTVEEAESVQIDYTLPEISE